MYYIMTDRLIDIDHIAQGENWYAMSVGRLKRDKLDILDYSDWSIESVSLNSLMSAIEDGRLALNDFLNLFHHSTYYRVGEGYIFSNQRTQFAAHDLLLRLSNSVSNNRVLTIELSGGRCLSLLVADATHPTHLSVNYKEVVPTEKILDLSFAHTLISNAMGYRFEIGQYTTVFLYREFFVVSQVHTCRRFPYISRSELARRCMLL